MRVTDWTAAHADHQIDSVEGGFGADPYYGDTFTAPFVSPGASNDERRVEKINAKELEDELTRLRAIKNRAHNQPLTDNLATALKNLEVLERIDETAEKDVVDGNRRLYVIYGKRAGLGRRTASYPSMQACPKSLRRILLRTFYHDIDIGNLARFSNPQFSSLLPDAFPLQV